MRRTRGDAARWLGGALRWHGVPVQTWHARPDAFEMVLEDETIYQMEIDPRASPDELWLHRDGMLAVFVAHHKRATDIAAKLEDADREDADIRLEVDDRLDWWARNME